MRQRHLIEKAVGPSPAYWQTFPGPTGADGRKYIWTHHGDAGPIAHLVTLNPRESPQTTLLALNRLCRAFAIPRSVGAGELAGIWCPEAAAARGEQPYLRMMAFDPGSMTAFTLDNVAGWFTQSNDRVYAATSPLAEFEISSGLAPGRHALDVPQEFRTLQEVILIAPYSAVAGDGAVCAIMLLRPRDGSVEVLPQTWFKAPEFDTTLQWIARATRDPVSRRLIGDGVRIGRFELTQDGTRLERWLE